MLYSLVKISLTFTSCNMKVTRTVRNPIANSDFSLTCHVLSVLKSYLLTFLVHSLLFSHINDHKPRNDFWASHHALNISLTLIWFERLQDNTANPSLRARSSLASSFAPQRERHPEERASQLHSKLFSETVTEVFFFSFLFKLPRLSMQWYHHGNNFSCDTEPVAR